MRDQSKKVKKEMLCIMRAAGIPPHLIYAYEKTGLLLLEEGYAALSPQQRSEYDAVIDEYFAKNPSNT